MNTIITILHHSLIILTCATWFYFITKMLFIPLFQAFNGNDEPINKMSLRRFLGILISGALLVIFIQNVRPPVQNNVTNTSVFVSDVEGDSIPPKKEVVTLSVTEILAQKVANNESSNSNSVKRFTQDLPK